MKSVQVFGRKKTATAVAYCKEGNGLVKLNGTPLDQIGCETLRSKLMEPLLLIGADRWQNLDIRIRVNGGGQVAQIYAIRQAVSKAIVAYYQKYVSLFFCYSTENVLQRLCIMCCGFFCILAF